MDNENIFRSLNLRMIAFPDTCHILDGNFLIADTDEAPFSIAEMLKDQKMMIFFNEPFKVEFALCVIIKSGTMRIMHNLKDYSLMKDDGFVVMPGDFAQCLDISPDCRLLVVAFSDSYYAPISNGGELNTFMSFFRRHPKASLEKEYAEDLIYVIDILKRRIDDPKCIDKKDIVRGYIYALCHESLDRIHSIRDEATLQNRGEEIFARFSELLAKNYLTEHHIKFYAGRMYLSPKHLSETVKAVSGRSVKEWIQDYILLEAKALLQSHKYSVQEISWRLNFANQSFFGTWFKKAAGMSPRQYMDRFE